MFDPSAPHIIILLVVVLLLFGSRRLPGAAKSLGQSMHIFKRSVSGLDADDDLTGGPAATARTSALPSAAPSEQPVTAQQLADLQRQVQELQRQSAGATGSQGSETQTTQPF